METLQRTGSFKFRGAANAILQLDPADGSRGVATHSSGNHALALATAARAHGFPCTVVMPHDASQGKRRAVQEAGAVVVPCEPTMASREATLAEVVGRSGATVIPPFDHPHVIAGQGTIGLEILEQWPQVDVIVAPVGGGGLVGGTALFKGQYGIRLDSPEFRGKLVKLDPEAPSVTVWPAPPSAAAMVGAYVFITNPVRRVAYKVLEAKPVAEGVELRLNMDPRIGTGQVSGVADFRVKTPTPFALQSYRYYHGARLVNKQRTAEYRIVEARNGTAAIIDAAAHPEAKAGKLAGEFANGDWFDIYDFGVGDEVVWPYSVSVVRTAPGVYQVTAPVKVELHLPEG